MIRILKLVLLLVVSQVAFAQAPSNYTNINGRYRWIAGMFDSTFHIPKGSTPSLRTGGSTNAGGLFYNTADSSVYTYTGTQWIKVRGSINPQDTTNKYVTQVYKKSGSDSIFYVKGGTHTWAFNDSTGSPGGGGGGKVYYFNGGVNMGTIGGIQMYELGDTANTGAAANFTRSTTGNIANFITDPGKPGLVQIPAGVWSVDAWLSETGGGANHAEIWIEVEKWDGSTITTIATSPIEQITEGATPNLYSWSVTIPTTTLAITDRIVIQFYISNTNGKTVTLYTQNGYVGEVHTTFTTGIGAINGLTAPAQYLVTGTSGTDFNINSSTATHTFNLPTASATNRGALSTTDWTTFNNKVGGSGITNYIPKWSGTGTIDTSQIYQSSGLIGIGTITPLAKVDIYDSAATALKVKNRAFGNNQNALEVRTDGVRGYTAILEQRDSVATGTQYMTGFRKGMLPGTGNPAPGGGTSFFTQIGNDNDVYRTTSIFRARAIDTTGFAAGPSIKGSSLEIWTLKNNAFDTTLVLNQGNVGVGTGQNGIDSNLTVQNGAWFERGVRMSGLPSGVGTKALRINASGTISIADTLIDAGGTVTSVATNTGTGITGGTITTSGTIAADTLLLSTRAWRQKGVDSVASLINTRISGTTNYIPKFTSSSAIGNSIVSESGSTISVAGGITASGIIATSGTGLNSSVRISNTTSSTGRDWHLYSLNNGNFGLYNNTDGAYAYQITPLGNLGLGVTPSAWEVTDSRVLQLNGGSLWSFSTSQINLLQNSYFNSSGNLIYTNNGVASAYRQISGVHSWYTAPSGTAGNAISFTQAMTLFSTGNLAVGGTTDNGYKLDVTGTGRFSGALNTTGGTRSIQMVSYAADWNYLKATGANFQIGTTDATNFYIQTNNTDRLTIASTGAATFSSSVTATSLILGNGNNLTWGGAYGANIPTIIGVSGASGYLTFYPSGSTNGEAARFTNNGNFGIGTTSPTQKVDVYGDRIRVNSPATNAGLMLAESGSDKWSVASVSSALLFYNEATASVRMTLTQGGNLGLGVTPSAGGLSGYVLFELANGGASIYSGANQNLNGTNISWSGGTASYKISNFATLYNQQSGQHQWYTAPSGTAGNAISFTQAMTLDASGNLFVGATSGSNTAGFTNRLYIESNIPSLTLSNTGTNTGKFTLGVTNGSFGIWNNATSTYPLFINSSNAATFSSSVSASSFTDGYITISGAQINRPATVEMQFSGAGDVRFFGNTAYPIRFITGTGAATFSSSVTASVVRSINGGVDGTFQDAFVGVYSGNNNEQNSIQTTVSSIAQSSGFRFQASNGGGSTGRTTVVDFVRDRAIFYTNVGIGTTSPSEKLEVVGNIVVSGADRSIYNSSTNALIFGTNNTERMRITSGGEILVNTTTDAGAYYLQVNGSVYATAYYESSDLRKKNVLSELVGSDGINTITFKWKDGRDSLTHIGYAAQQVEKVLPDAVKTNPDGYKTINYDEVQTLKIANLEKEITELKEMIKKLIK